MKKLKVLDLFSGIGGFSLGLERSGGFETVAFCEIDKYCQQVLKKHWPEVPIHEDVRNLDYDGPVDLICGGYPCQPFSVAGNRKGAEDDRHLWPAMFSLIKKHKPNWVIGENVAGHINMGLDDVLADLESEGYTVQTFIIPACAVDAKHRRDRLWIIANANMRCGETGTNRTGRKEGAIIDRGGKGSNLANTKCGENNSIRRTDKPGRNTLGRNIKATQQEDGKTSSNSLNRCSEDVADTNSGRTTPSPEGRNQEGYGTINCGEDVGNASIKGLQDGGSSQVGKSCAIEEPKRPGRTPSKIIPNTVSKRGCSGDTIRENAEDVRQQSGCEARRGREFKIWKPEPSVGRVVNGLSGRVDRLKGLGNAVVPQIPEIIGHAILEAMDIDNEA